MVAFYIFIRPFSPISRRSLADCSNYAPIVSPEPIVVLPSDLNPGGGAQGKSLAVANWPTQGLATEVAPLHVHHHDDEAWYVVEGALRFRLADRELIAPAGSTVFCRETFSGGSRGLVRRRATPAPINRETTLAASTGT